MRKLNTYKPKPFIKWVGGKSQLLHEIDRSLPYSLLSMDDSIYIEPFVGGGAVLFYILTNFQNIKTVIINDINPKLICTYKIVRDNVDALISNLKTMQEEYLELPNNERKNYFVEKREEFNTDSLSELDIATLFIFLNKTCFNGLYRVNGSGRFNVPHGKYSRPIICDEQTLKTDSIFLKKVIIECGDFYSTLKNASSRSFYYIDSPYKPLTETSSFTSYSSGGFDDNEQVRLKQFCDELSRNGAVFLESNSNPALDIEGKNFFDYLYSDYSIRRVNASRMINSDSKKRGAIKEILITNNENINERF